MEKDERDKLRKLYPGLSDAELGEAQERIDEYLMLAWEMFEEHNFDLPDAKSSQEKSIPRRVDSIFRKFDSSPGSF